MVVVVVGSDRGSNSRNDSVSRTSSSTIHKCLHKSHASVRVSVSEYRQ